MVNFCNWLEKVKKFFIKYLTDGNGCIMFIVN